MCIAYSVFFCQISISHSVNFGQISVSHSVNFGQIKLAEIRDFAGRRYDRYCFTCDGDLVHFISVANLVLLLKNHRY